MGDQQIGKTVIIKVARADPLTPARSSEASGRADFGELAFPVVPIQMMALRSDGPKSFQAGSIDNQNVIIAVIVNIENRYTCSCGFQDIVFAINAPKSSNSIETVCLRIIQKNEGAMGIGSGQKSE